jgi:hypothetical protein
MRNVLFRDMRRIAGTTGKGAEQSGTVHGFGCAPLPRGAPAVGPYPRPAASFQQN